ncbi:MAG: hypothetical protein ACRC0X_09360 [Brevinema sp.]
MSTDITLGSQLNIRVADSDILVLDGEIVLGYEDLELVSRSECLLQDVRNLLMTDFGALFYDKTYGSGVLRYIHTDKSRLRQLKQQIMIALKKDSKIVSNSIKTDITIQENGITISVEFKTLDHEKLSTNILI